MKFLHLIWKNIWRKKTRTLFTILAIAVACVLFGVLAAVKTAFSMGVDVTGADRLVLLHKVSIMQLLPKAYEARIESVPGVDSAVHATWFGGYYQEESNFFAQVPVDPEEYLAMFPEFLVSPEDRERWLTNRGSALVGRYLADRFGWEVGDRVPITATIWNRKDGSRLWEFDIAGIYDGAEQATDETQFLFHYEYFNEARTGGEDMVGWYTVRVENPEEAVAVAEAIDSRFANSPYETKTATEKAFVQGFADQIGNIEAIASWVVAAVFLALLLIAANAMVHAVRERFGELAVLKTLGFTDRGVLALVVGEGLMIALMGATLGFTLAVITVQGMAQALSRFLPIFFLDQRDLLVGIGLIAVLGLVASLLPAIMAMRLSIVQALRRA